MNQDEKASAVKSARVGVASDVTAALTLLSMVPYELGALSIVIPPEIKPWVAGIGIGSTIVLRLWKRWQELRTTQEAATEP